MFFRPSNAVKLIGLPFVCLAMFAVAGGHWAVFQAVAWGQMLVNYSQEAGSLVIGAKKTFSGDFPCPMCQKVAEGKKKEAEQAPLTVKTDKKVELAFVNFGDFVVLPTLRDEDFRSTIFGFSSRSDPPPKPVPLVVA